jgi:hypothetical protein
MWTWAGTDRWHHVAEFPLPDVMEENPEWARKWLTGKPGRKAKYSGRGQIQGQML